MGIIFRDRRKPGMVFVEPYMDVLVGVSRKMIPSRHPYPKIRESNSQYHKRHNNNEPIHHPQL